MLLGFLKVDVCLITDGFRPPDTNCSCSRIWKQNNSINHSFSSCGDFSTVETRSCIQGSGVVLDVAGSAKLRFHVDFISSYTEIICTLNFWLFLF